MFFESASEEREHAMKIMEYLLMRGQLTSGVHKLLNFPVVSVYYCPFDKPILKEIIQYSHFE